MMSIQARLVLLATSLSLVSCTTSQYSLPENPALETSPIIRIETGAGDVVVRLDLERAPITARNFLRYVDADAYDGASFYRVTRPENDPMIEVIQGGLILRREDESAPNVVAAFPPIEHETTEVTGISHSNGAISMARAEPGTATTEFFITIGDNPELDYGGIRNPDGQGFAAFGRVIEGMDVVRRIQGSDTDEAGAYGAQSLRTPIEINAISRLHRDEL